MNLNECRDQMESYRRSVDEEGKSLKDSYLALDRLHSWYRKFDVEERAMADQVLAEWALSEDENVRFDALALIDDFKIATRCQPLRHWPRALLQAGRRARLTNYRRWTAFSGISAGTSADVTSHDDEKAPPQ